MTPSSARPGDDAGSGPVEFGKYTLMRQIGVGGMATVYLARKTMGTVQKAVALKVSNDFVGLDAKRREGILNEIRIAGRMRHSNIVSVMDAGEHGGVVFIELELIDGHDLSQFVEELARRGQQLPFSIIAYILRGILEGLNYAHIDFMIDGVSQQVVHRDLTPSNVILSTSGEVKIIDFGIGKYFDEHTSGAYLKGKPRYMAPEHATGSSSPSIDIFPVGAILYELIEGKRFRHEVHGGDMYTTAAGGYVPALTRTDTPQAFRVLYDALTAPDPKRRVHSAIAAMAMLDLWEGRPAQASELRALVRVHTGGTHSGYTQGEIVIPPGLEAAVAMANARAGAARATPARAEGTPQGRPEPTVDAPRPRDSDPDAPRGTVRGSVTPGPARAAANEGESTATEPQQRAGVPVSSESLEPSAFVDRTAVLSAPAFVQVHGANDPAMSPTPAVAQRSPAPEGTPEPRWAAEPARARDPEDTVFVVSRGGIRTWHVVAALVAVLATSVGVGMLVAARSGDTNREAEPAAVARTVEPSEPPTAADGPKTAAEGPALAPIEFAPEPSPAAIEPAAEPAPAAPATQTASTEVPATQTASTGVPATAAAEPAPPVAAPKPKAPAVARKPAAKAPAAKVTVRIIPMLAQGDLQIGKHVHPVGASSFDLALPTGKHRVRWRPGGESTWVDRPALSLSAGHDYLLHVSTKGTKLTAKDKP